MTHMSDLHAAAMSLAGQADTARRASNSDLAQSLFRDAFLSERDAAMLAPPDMEPTRTVLLRSAASLALECGGIGEAERLVALGLAGNGPEELRDELRNLFETINFHRHLEVRGKNLSPTEIQLALAGDAVGYGLIPADEYLPRIEIIESLLVRTTERQRGLEFRERGRPLKIVTDDFAIYMSAALAGSFAVTIRVGRPLKQLQLFTPETEIVDEFLECIRLFSNDDRRGLSDHITSPAYLRNFVQQAKKLAPDGQRIRTVGFTARDADGTKSVALRHVPSSQWSTRPSPEQNTVRIVGELTEAAKRQQSNTIKLREDNGKVRTIQVPKGLMSDIVRPLWERRVAVTGREVAGVVRLKEIEPIDDNEDEERLDNLSADYLR